MVNNVILSIKPKYVKEILGGNKKYEYRKKIFKKDIDKVYIYESAPKKRIIGYFIYKGALEGDINFIWNETCDFSGISKLEYNEYFNNKNKAYAIIIEEIYLFKEPLNPYKIFGNFIAPQSYKYIKINL